MISNTSLQDTVIKRVIIAFSCFIITCIAHANKIDSIYVKQYDQTRYFCSDSIFQKLAVNGYLGTINDMYDYYEDILNYLPSDRQIQEVSKMRYAAKKYNSQELSFEADYMYALVLPVKRGNDISFKISKMEEVITKATKRNNLIMKIRGMEAIFKIYWESSLYSKAFSQAYLIDKELENITDAEYPGRGLAYYQIGKAYYFFNDYDKAIPYLRRALTSPTYYFDKSDLLARNLIGSYYNQAGNIDSAEYYFRSAYFSTENVKSKTIIDAASLSNIGKCLINRGEPDKAIPYLRAGLTRILVDKDYELASGVTLELAKCYLEKKDFRKAKNLIDSTQLFIRRSDNADLYQSLYPLMCKYHSNMGNTTLAAAFFDSTLMVNKAHQNKYNSLHILKAEQDLYEAGAKAKDEEIKMKEETFRYQIFYGVIIILLISSGLVISIVLYHKKQVAYRALIQKNQEWASVTSSYVVYDSENRENNIETLPIGEITEEEGEATSEDIALMKDVYELISKDKIFKNTDLTLDSMAKQMNINRNYLSKAINKTTRKNFNTYINEYRVKEAVKILSNKKSDVISIDAIAFDVGFNNRTSFYQSFKKITGLSPSDFRKNKPV